MPSTRVLVVNDDPWTQRMVSAVLVHAGHSVEIAADGSEGLRLAGQLRPDLVIANLDLPMTDGRSFIQTLRSRPGNANTPAIFLTDRPPPPEHNPALDCFLHRRFRVEELESLVDELTSRVLGLTPAPRAVPLPPDASMLTPAESNRRSSLAGDLEAFALSSILIVLEMERKTGVLSVRQAERTGRIVLREGRVIRATFDGGKIRGAQAVYELLTWNHGRFDWLKIDVEGEDEIKTSTQFLLLEGARRLDERNHAKKKN